MYVLVRKDLPGSQPAVQAGHALAQYLIDYPDNEWTNGTLIYLKVDSEWDLLQWWDKLLYVHPKHSCFREPDIGNEMTAIAAFDNTGRLENLFRNISLL